VSKLGKLFTNSWGPMNNWNEAELAFRCERLSVRLERLAESFLRMGQLSQDVANADLVLEIVKESKSFLELTAIDLDFDSAFELAQMQRQLCRWHFHWAEIWDNDGFREISNMTGAWADRVRAFAGVLV
jgi:hypothetical protein